jgi:hypothetical protein
VQLLDRFLRSTSRQRFVVSSSTRRFTVQQNFYGRSSSYRQIVNTAMESDPAANVFALPARRGEQTLQGYVREHLRQIEQALSFGVPYTAIMGAVHTAGFAGTSVHTMEQAVYRARRHKPRFSVTLEPRSAPEAKPSPIPRSPNAPRPSMQEEMVAFKRRLRELARPPKLGEPDPLN